MTGFSAPRRIVIVAHYYPPEATAASNRLSAIARALASAGHDVTVVTGRPSFPDGVIPKQYRKRSRGVETEYGVRIKRVSTYASARLRSIDRLLNWMSVALGATWYMLTRREPVDVLLVSSPPITLALPALVGALRHRARLVLDVRDVYPEIAVKMGVWKPQSLLARLVAAVSEAVYRRASLIFAVTETCRQEILQHGVAPGKVVTASNGFDRIGAARKAPFQRTNGEFVVAYAGNMGVATGMDVILNAARELPADKYRFVLAGGGAEATALVRRIERERFGNITLLGAQPRDVAAALVRDADVCIVPLKRGIVDSLPTKLFDALAMGTPVIACADGEARRFVEQSGGGLTVPPEDGHALAVALEELATDPIRRRALGCAGQSYVTQHCDRAAIVADIVRHIQSVTAA